MTGQEEAHHIQVVMANNMAWQDLEMNVFGITILQVRRGRNSRIHSWLGQQTLGIQGVEL